MLIIHYRGGIEGSLEAGMATHSSILAWKIPWTEAPGESTVHRVAESDTTECLAHTHIHIEDLSRLKVRCLLFPQMTVV